MTAIDEKLPAVFRSRAAELNMEEAAIAKAVDEKIASLGAFGFCTKYVQGNDDETPLEDLARMLHDLNGTDRPGVDINVFF